MMGINIYFMYIKCLISDNCLKKRIFKKDNVADEKRFWQIFSRKRFKRIYMFQILYLYIWSPYNFKVAGVKACFRGFIVHNVFQYVCQKNVLGFYWWPWTIIIGWEKEKEEKKKKLVLFVSIVPKYVKLHVWSMAIPKTKKKKKKVETL